MEDRDGLHLLNEVLSFIPETARNVVIALGEHEIACSSDILAAQSAFFSSRLSTFADASEFERDCYLIHLPVEEVTLEALAVCIKFLQNGDSRLREENAFDVLRASAFLQIDSLVKQCSSYISKQLDKCNLVQAWDFSNALEISELKTFIERATKNFYATRRRKYGPFDLNVNIKSFSIPCHKNIVFERSTRLKSLCQLPLLEFEKIDIGDLLKGEIMHRNQAVFNVIEWMYSASSFLLTSESFLEHLQVVRALHCDSLADMLCDQFQPSLPNDWKEFYIASIEMNNLNMRTVALLHMARSFQQLRPAAVDLSPDDLKRLLRSNILVSESESDVLATLRQWHDHAPEARGPHLEDLVPSVRWSQVPRADIDSLSSCPVSKAFITSFAPKVDSSLGKRSWPKHLIMVELPHPARALTAAQRKNLGVHRFDFASKRWTVEARLGLLGDYTAAVAADGVLYLAEQRPEADWEGHCIVLHSFDLKTGSFRHSVATNTTPTHERNVCCYVTSENSLMFASSKISASEEVYIERYFINEKRWVTSHVVVNKKRRTHHTKEASDFENACLVSGRTAAYLINAGLREGAGEDVTVAEVTTATSASLLCQQRAPQTKPRTVFCEDPSLSCGSTFAIFNDDLVRVGGFDTAAKTLSRADVIDVTSTQLRHREALPKIQFRRYLCGVVQNDDRLLVAGGYERSRSESKPRVVNSMEEYDPNSRLWNKVEQSMPHLESGYVKLFVVDAPVKFVLDQITAGADIF
jgi:hypothetical protein